MLTTGEVAKLFQVSAQTVINWLVQGRMPYERIGRGPRRLTEETVLKYIKETGISPSALDQTIFARTLKRFHSSEQDITDSVAVVNSGMVLIGWNDGAGALTGLESVDVLGKSITSLIHKVREHDKNIETLLKNDWNAPSLEIEVTHASKQSKPVNLSLTASRFYSQGNLAGYILVYRKK